MCPTPAKKTPPPTGAAAENHQPGNNLRATAAAEADSPAGGRNPASQPATGTALAGRAGTPACRLPSADHFVTTTTTTTTQPPPGRRRPHARGDDSTTSWVVLRHPVYGHLGWFLGRRVFR